jgi:gluconolactonase
MAEIREIASGLQFPEGPVAMPDPLATNICFGGRDLSTAYITLSGTGKLASMKWPRPGLKLNF